MNVNLLANSLRLGLVEFSWTSAFQIVNTLILFFALKKLLFKPVTEFMETRESEIKDKIQDADQRKAEALQLKEEYNEKLDKAEEEGRQIIREKSQAAEVRANQIIKDAKAEVSTLKDNAQKEIESERVKAVNSLKDDIASLAVLAASKVVEKDLDVDNHKVLIDKFINEVGDTKWQN